MNVESCARSAFAEEFMLGDDDEDVISIAASLISDTYCPQIEQTDNVSISTYAPVKQPESKMFKRDQFFDSCADGDSILTCLQSVIQDKESKSQSFFQRAQTIERP